jgi:hypothetical protein
MDEKNLVKNAIVRRIVPGRIVYVSTTADEAGENTYAFKLDRIIIKDENGGVRPYRGEPLSDLGVAVGKEVSVSGEISPQNHDLNLIVEPGKKSKHGNLRALVESYFKR